MFDEVIKHIKTHFPKGFIPLHAPVFVGNEKEYLNEDPEEYYDMYCQDQNLN